MVDEVEIRIPGQDEKPFAPKFAVTPVEKVAPKVTEPPAASKAPFAPERGVAARVKAEAMARGLLCYAMAGTIDGRTGDHAMLAPPFIVTAAQIEEIVGRFAEAVEAGTGAA